MQCDQADASNVSIHTSSESSKPVAFADDGMDVDESPITSTGPYEVLTVPGKPHLIAELKFKDEGYEEDEAEMSAESDGEDDEIEEGNSADISAAILLDKSIDETEDSEDDEDYVPKE